MLQQAAIDDLARSGLSPEEAEAAMIFDTPSARTIDAGFADTPALVFPYLQPDDSPVLAGSPQRPFVRVRYLSTAGHLATIRGKAQRYAQPVGSGCQIYLPPVIDWRPIMEDPRYPIVITEGEKKALAGCFAGMNVIGLGGVHNFLWSGFLHPALRAFEWAGRRVQICFDSDAAFNTQVGLAERRLMELLGMHYGARASVVRLPQEDATKVGLDDFIVAQGATAAKVFIESTPKPSALEVEVMRLNEHVAWIEREGAVFDFAQETVIPRLTFTAGSKYSTFFVPTLDEKGKPKNVQLAKAWLCNPRARRYDDVLFRPGLDRAVPLLEGDGVALNLWSGWRAEQGSITPFIDLTRFLFQALPADIANDPLKYVAWHAQNPCEKWPLALMLVGPQGSGKSLWSEIVRDAFHPYVKALSGEKFVKDEHPGWLEKTCLATIDEMSPLDALHCHDRLKNAISQERQPMNEKYRVERDVMNYTMFIITTNYHEVASLTNDDRRMFVISCPDPRKLGPKDEQLAFFNKIVAWKKAGGPKKLMWWLLHLDLKGWVPPQRAPLTQEKQAALVEGQSPIQRAADRMRESGSNIVKAWCDQAYQWALNESASTDGRRRDAASAILDVIPHWRIKPWYSATELAALLPPVTGMFTGARVTDTSATGISRQLRNAGVPLLRSKDPRGFKWRGEWQQFLVVHDADTWCTDEIAQADFEKLMEAFPRYADLRKRGSRT